MIQTTTPAQAYGAVGTQPPQYPPQVLAAAMGGAQQALQPPTQPGSPAQGLPATTAPAPTSEMGRFGDLAQAVADQYKKQNPDLFSANGAFNWGKAMSPDRGWAAGATVTPATGGGS